MSVQCKYSHPQFIFHSTSSLMLLLLYLCKDYIFWNVIKIKYLSTKTYISNLSNFLLQSIQITVKLVKTHSTLTPLSKIAHFIA